VNEALLAAAYRMQQAGNLVEAARLYGEILRHNPRHFGALYMLAYVHFGSASYETAERLFEMASGLDPKFVDAHFARGCALQNLNRHETAVQAFDKALALQRDHADALVNRGVSLLELGRGGEAMADFDRALALDPRHVEAFANRGVALLELKRHDEALSCLERALALAPNHTVALINRANALRGLGLGEEALVGYDAVLGRDPRNVEVLSNRGVVLTDLKRYEEALQSFERALEQRPDHVNAWFNRGNALLETRRFSDARACFDKALSAAPDNVDAIVNRASAFLGERNFDEAMRGFDRALSLDPGRTEALGNRAAALFELRRYEEAQADAERLVAVTPDYPYAKGLLLRCRLHVCDWRGLESQKAAIAADVMAGKRAIQPFAQLSLGDSPAEQLRCAQIQARNEYPAAPALWRGERYRHEKIRVAYLSADFCAHATAHLMAGVFEAHDRQHFETMAFSFGRDDGSPMRERLKRAFGRVVEVSDKNDAQAAALIKETEADIAIDLKGYTQESRPGILAHRPAPVQVNYLGYSGTMGADYIDYIVADRIVVPEADRIHYGEKVVYLPDSYQCNDSKRQIAERTPTRAEAVLPETGFVFCSFNNSYKILPEMFALWMRLLHAVNGSVLWLLEDNQAASRNLRREAEARGISAERLCFAPRAQPSDHLARHRLADLFLDTLPYNAHTTASDALWAGLPVLTTMGTTFAGRVAGSLLHAVGLPELVTSSLADYEALALKLVRDRRALLALRAKLARNLGTHPLFDTARFTRALEAAYTTMRQRSARGQAPRSFAVSGSGL
jgi:protein O-GlcNAc transferase